MQLCTFTPAISFAMLSSPYTSSLNYMHARKVQVNMHDFAIVCVFVRECACVRECRRQIK